MESTVRFITIQGDVDANNSTTTPLAAGGTWSGTATEIVNDGIVFVNVYSDVASAENGLHIEQSSDGVNWDHHDEYTVPAATGKNYSINPHARYFRVHYTNGGSNQTVFRLQSILKSQNAKPSSHRIKDTISDNDDATLGVVIPKLRTAQDNYVSMSATNAGNQKISLEEYNGQIAENGLPIMIMDGNKDPFGNLRVAMDRNRFDLEFLYDKQPLQIDEVVNGGASAAHGANGRDVVLSINNTTNGTSAALYSHVDIPYTPGNGQLIEITGALDNAAIGGGIAQVFLRTTVTGSTTETVADQSDWNVNTVNDVDWRDSQIFMVDFQSLRVGRIRYYLNRGGDTVKVHEITNDNVRNTGYWQTPTLPPYWIIYNDATYTYLEVGYGDTLNAVGFRYRIAKNASAQLRAICVTVKSSNGDGLFELPGLPFTANNGVVAKTVSTTQIPIISIRPKATFNSIVNRMLMRIEEFELATTNPILYEFYYRPTLTGASWVSADINSGMEYDVTASAFSGGTKIKPSGYVLTSRNVTSGLQGLLGRILLTVGRSGVADILTLTAVRYGTVDASVTASLGWSEIR